jgi:asparagine synthase (glutamine-hydrolysing)
LEALFARTEGQWFLMVRERLAGIGAQSITEVSVDAERFDQLYRECLMWPLDYVLLEVAQAGHRLKVRSGVYGVAPLYCRANLDQITLSWDPADLLAPSMAVDMEIASHCLVLDTVYSARQVCVGVAMLTERASLYVEPGRASYQYPKAAEDTVSLGGLSGEEVLEEFNHLLQRVVSKRPAASKRIAIQLSGGMDSAAVAGALATTHGALQSGGILLNGACRKSQVSRREHIAGQLGLNDETIEMSSFPPSLDLYPTGREYQLKEFYLEAFEALWRTMQARECEWLFTGVGGDELFLPRSDELLAADGKIYVEIRHHAESLLTPRALGVARSLRGFDAPMAPMPVSSLLAQACHAPHLLKRGLWPVNPLCDPSLVAFCHRLAPEHRQNRETLHRYLQSRFGKDVFPSGYIKETFVRVLPELIARQASGIAGQLRECALADLGLVSRDAVLALLDTVKRTRSEVLTAPLANFLWLERFVRQLG